MPTVIDYENTAKRRKITKVEWLLIVGLISLVVGGYFQVRIWLLSNQRPPSDICARQIRQIGLGLMLYANANGEYPPTFAELALDQGLQAQTFVCPSSKTATVASGTTPTMVAAAIAAPGGVHCSFTYVIANWNLTAVQANDIIVFESQPDDSNGVVNLLFGDGHVNNLFAGPGEPDVKTFANLQADFAAGIRPLRLRP